MMSSGSRHICVIDKYGNLWGWGYNKFGQIIQTKDESMNIIWSPLKIKTKQKVTFVKCGHWYTLFE